jgi:hypothetical protein
MDFDFLLCFSLVYVTAPRGQHLSVALAVAKAGARCGAFLGAVFYLVEPVLEPGRWIVFVFVPDPHCDKFLYMICGIKLSDFLSVTGAERFLFCRLLIALSLSSLVVNFNEK